MSTRHHGFQIVPRPYQIERTGLWTVDLEIHRKQLRRSFSFTSDCPTELDAIDRCLDLGREIIDGQLPGRSVDSLRERTRFSVRHLLLACGLIVCLSAFGYNSEAAPLVLARLELIGSWMADAALIVGVAVLGSVGSGR